MTSRLSIALLALTWVSACGSTPTKILEVPPASFEFDQEKEYVAIRVTNPEFPTGINLFCKVPDSGMVSLTSLDPAGNLPKCGGEYLSFGEVVVNPGTFQALDNRFRLDDGSFLLLQEIFRGATLGAAIVGLRPEQTYVHVATTYVPRLRILPRGETEQFAFPAERITYLGTWSDGGGGLSATPVLDPNEDWEGFADLFGRNFPQVPPGVLHVQRPTVRSINCERGLARGAFCQVTQ